MKRLWRCQNCTDPGTRKRLEFVAEAGPHGRGVCPSCGAGKDPRTAQVVLALKVVHFDPPTAVGGVGENKPACGAKRAAGGMMTGDANAANCPACKDTPAWKDAKDRLDNPEAYRVPDGPQPAKVAPPTAPKPDHQPEKK